MNRLIILALAMTFASQVHTHATSDPETAASSGITDSSPAVAQEIPDSTLINEANHAVSGIPIYRKPITMSITCGPVFNLASNKNDMMFGPVPDVVFDINYKIDWYFLKHWGAYFGFSLLTHSQKNNWDKIFHQEFEELYDECGFGKIRGASWEIGVSYQTSFKRFTLQGRIGYGINGHSEYPWASFNEEHSKIIEINRNLWHKHLNLGFSATYRISRVFGIVLDVFHRLPLSRSHATVDYYTDDEVTKRIHYSSKAYGNNLGVAVGFQLMCEGARPKRAKTCE